MAGLHKLVNNCDHRMHKSLKSLISKQLIFVAYFLIKIFNLGGHGTIHSRHESTCVIYPQSCWTSMWTRPLKWETRTISCCFQKKAA